MILTGSRLYDEIAKGRIVVEPFRVSSLNPNSYNYHLGKQMKLAPPGMVDPKENNIWDTFDIPDEGMILQPSILYLGHTIEIIGSLFFVTSLIGRSSVGRLGLYVQVSADLSQLGAIHRWTLEITVIQPVRVYKGMEIGQVSFWEPTGDIILYDGEYGNISTPLESKRFEFSDRLGD